MEFLNFNHIIIVDTNVGDIKQLRMKLTTQQSLPHHVNSDSHDMSRFDACDISAVTGVSAVDCDNPMPI